jgi:group I intron endonuclease
MDMTKSLQGQLRMSMPGVYMILNIYTNARYVGSTGQNLSHRWSQHKSKLNKGQSGNPDLQKFWSAMGPTAFAFVVLEQCTTNHFEREQYWMDRFRHQGLTLYNRTPEAKTHRGMKMPSGFGDKIRKAQLGSKHKMSEQGLANIRKATSHPRHDVSELFSKPYRLISPAGEVVTGTNLLQLCKQHGLDMSAMAKVNKGLRPSHKGWHQAPR